MSCQVKCASPKTPTYISTATVTLKTSGFPLNSCYGAPQQVRKTNGLTHLSPNSNVQNSFIKTPTIRNKNVFGGGCEPNNQTSAFQSLQMTNIKKTGLSRSQEFSTRSTSNLPRTQNYSFKILSGNMIRSKSTSNVSKSNSPTDKYSKIQQDILFPVFNAKSMSRTSQLISNTAKSTPDLRTVGCSPNKSSSPSSVPRNLGPETLKTYTPNINANTGCKCPAANSIPNIKITVDLEVEYTTRF